MKHIYKIENTINGKLYIGQTSNMDSRWGFHGRDSRRHPNNLRFNSPLYKDMNLHGMGKFYMELIETEKDEEAHTREQYWIKELNTLYPEGYNLTTGGEEGKTYSDITKQRIGEKTKERWEDPEISERMLEGLRRGTETIKRTQTGVERVERVVKNCPECGNEFRRVPHEETIHCSYSCASKVRNRTGLTKERIDNYVAERKEVHEQIKVLAESWAMKNKTLVLDAKLNRITPTLKPLTDEIEELYDVKDYRTISTAIAGTESRKELMLYLKDFVK